MSGLTDEASETFVEHAPTLTAAAIPFSQTISFRIGQGEVLLSRARSDANIWAIQAICERDARFSNYASARTAADSPPMDTERGSARAALQTGST